MGTQKIDHKLKKINRNSVFSTETRKYKVGTQEIGHTFKRKVQKRKGVQN